MLRNLCNINSTVGQTTSSVYEGSADVQNVLGGAICRINLVVIIERRQSWQVVRMAGVNRDTAVGHASKRT